jgi:RNA polymerase sigma factor for flagellar operon FliA
MARAATLRAQDTGTEDVGDLWRDFKNDGCPVARDRLILHYMHLASYVAGCVRAGVPRTVTRDDLVSSGVVGLIVALERFDLTRSVKFETYATRRIRGAMQDEMRALDWVPRSVREKATAFEHATEKLQFVLGRNPSAKELAAELKIDVEDLFALRAAMAKTQVMLEAAMTMGDAEDGDRAPILDSVADADADQPSAELEGAEIRQALIGAIDALGERERTMIWLYYFEEYTLARIGRIWGVSESRVAQIHAKALRELRHVEPILACGESFGWTLPAAADKEPASEVGELEAIRIARRRNRTNRTRRTAGSGGSVRRSA